MKRYSLIECSDFNSSWQELMKNENGGLVRYEDAMARIAELEAERDEARALVREVFVNYDVWDAEMGQKFIAAVNRWECAR